MNNTHKKICMLVILLAGCALTSLWGSFTGGSSEDKSLVPKLALGSKQEQRTEKTLRIYVSGAVLEPGLYDVPVGSRAEAAILAAGGMTEEADSTRVNLARKLKDGNQVNVPRLKQGRAGSGQAKAAANTSKRTKAKNTASEEKRSGSPAAGTRVRINSASVSELQALPGIGPSLAKRIASARQQARFSSVEDLLRVPGIGKAKLERLRELVEVD